MTIADLSLPPLVIQGCSWLCQDERGTTGLLPRAVEWDLDAYSVEVIDPEVAKDWCLLDCQMQCARRSGIEQIYLSVPTWRVAEVKKTCSDLVHMHKSLRGLRVEVCAIEPREVRSQCDFIRHLYSVWGFDDFSKGFFYVPWSTHVRGNSKDFATLLEFHRNIPKRGTTILSFWPYRANPKSAGFAGSHRDVVVTASKTSQLLSLVQINSYEEDSVNWKRHVDPHCARWNPPPESIDVRSDLSFMDSFFFATVEFQKLCVENFDYQSFREVVENVLTSQMDLHSIGIYQDHLAPFKRTIDQANDICTVQSGFCTSSPRNLWQFCCSEAHVYSDSLYLKGKSSHWKIFGSDSKSTEETSGARQPTAPRSAVIYHDSISIPTESTLTISDSLVMIYASVPSIGEIRSSVIGPYASVGEGCHISKTVVLSGVSLPDNVDVEGPAFIANADSELPSASEDPFWEKTKIDEGVECWKLRSDLSPETRKAVELDIFPSLQYLKEAKPLIDDASLNPESLLDAIYTSDESEGEGDCRKGQYSHSPGPDVEADKGHSDDFIEEAQSMLLTVIHNPTNIENIKLELRNYRLAAGKMDIDLLKAILPVIFAKAYVNLGSDVRTNQKMVTVSGLEGLVNEFMKARPEENSYKAFYDCLLEFVRSSLMIDVTETTTGDSSADDGPKLTDRHPFPTSRLSGDEQFVRISCAFGNLNHAAYIANWVAARKGVAPEILETSHMARYIAFLEQSDESESDSDSDSSSS